MDFFTIGVYNSSEKDFFDKLLNNDIDTFCDIRQRRAVRGSKYAFVNSCRLQKKLAEMGVKYIHKKDLAPTKEIRELQKEEDLRNGELKRNRQSLGNSFVSEFNNKVLNNFNFNEFISELKDSKSRRIILFCVEESHEACHRSLVSEKLKIAYKFNVEHL